MWINIIEDFSIRFFLAGIFLVIFLNIINTIYSFSINDRRKRYKLVAYNTSNFITTFIVLVILIEINYAFRYGIYVPRYSFVRYLFVFGIIMRKVYIDEILKYNKNDYTRITATVIKMILLGLMLPIFDPIIKRGVAKIIFYILCVGIIDESITMFVKIMKYVKSNITLTSLVEVFEKINTGILFADSRGRIKMINPYMTRLIESIGVGRASNISEVLDKIEKSNNNPIKKYIENSIMLELDDGSVNQIFKTDVKIKRRRYIQITAYDISRKYRILEEIEKKNKEIEEYNKDLYEILKNIENLILDKKAINIRQKVHDVIGQRLSIIVMAIREIELLGNSRADLSELNELINTLLEDLKKESIEENLDIFEYLVYSFRLIGVEIIIKGEIPEENEIRTNITYILREAVTNAIYHAEANKIYMSIDEDEENWDISIWDNGEIKKSTFVEGIGLRGIKRRVENVLNGALKIEYKDKFILNFIFPKEKK